MNKKKLLRNLKDWCKAKMVEKFSINKTQMIEKN